MGIVRPIGTMQIAVGRLARLPACPTKGDEDATEQQQAYIMPLSVKPIATTCWSFRGHFHVALSVVLPTPNDACTSTPCLEPGRSGFMLESQRLTPSL